MTIAIFEPDLIIEELLENKLGNNELSEILISCVGYEGDDEFFSVVLNYTDNKI